MKTTDLSEQQRLEDPNSPRTNDDLTIAENIRIWSETSQEEGKFVDETGDCLRIPNDRVEEFIERFGALHPGDYRAKFDRDWRNDFKALNAGE